LIHHFCILSRSSNTKRETIQRYHQTQNRSMFNIYVWLRV
jgi:hypothetical protein